MNGLFIEDGLSENEIVMEQLCSNSKEQAMLGQFPESITKAIIESMDIHNEMTSKLLSNELVAKGFAGLMF